MCPEKAELEKKLFLANLLAHEKNIVMPQEIKQMVSQGKNAKRVPEEIKQMVSQGKNAKRVKR
jgi:hypothetical protein